MEIGYTWSWCSPQSCQAHPGLSRDWPPLFTVVIDDSDYRRQYEWWHFSEPFIPSWFTFYTVAFDSEITLIWNKMLPPACVAVSFLVPKRMELKRESCISHNSLRSLSGKNGGFEFLPYTDYLPSRDSCAWREAQFPKASSKAQVHNWKMKGRRSTPI